MGARAALHQAEFLFVRRRGRRALVLRQHKSVCIFPRNYPPAKTRERNFQKEYF